MASPSADLTAGRILNDPADPWRSEHIEMNAHSAYPPGATSSSGIGSSNPPLATDSSRTNIPPQVLQIAVPMNVDIIDLDALPDPASSITIDLDALPDSTPTVKIESGDELQLIKSEPIEGLKPFCSWSNTRNDAIVIQDDEDPPPAFVLMQQPVQENTDNKIGASPRLEDVPMLDDSPQDALTPHLQRPITTPLPVEDDMDVDMTEKIHGTFSTDPVLATEIITTTTTSATTGLNPTAETISAPAAPNLGASILSPRRPAQVGASANLSFRDRVRKAQKSIKANAQALRNDLASHSNRPPLNQPAPRIKPVPVNKSIHRNAPVVLNVPALRNEQTCDQISVSNGESSSASTLRALGRIAQDRVPKFDDDTLDDPFSDHFDYDEFDNEFDDEYPAERKKLKEEIRQCEAQKTLEGEIRAMQLQSQYDNLKARKKEDRMREKQQRRADDQEESFFVEDEPNEVNNLLEEDDNFNRLSKYQPSQQSGMGKHKAIIDVDEFKQILEAELGPKLKSVKCKGSSKDKSKKPNDKKSLDKIGRAAKVSKQKHEKMLKNKQLSLLDVGSLFTSDVIRAAQANQGQAPLPAMTSARRDHALKTLVASVPQENRKMAQVDKNYLDSACKDFVGRMSVRAHPGNDGWTVNGLTCILKHHQLLGAAFMRRRERGNDLPRGGINADQMGLGKTIMMLANIVNGRPPKGWPHGYEGPKTTLIVATPALITQWYNEIQTHTSREKKPNWKPLRTTIFKGRTMLMTSDGLIAYLSSYDIVLTTYHEVRRSMPKEEYPLELQTQEEKQAWWMNYFEEKKGLLHRIPWLRVVLDEAQAIKNHRSWTSMACRTLPGKHRWALSGTPIQNRASELYSYFKFLDVQHTGSFKIFCRNFIGSNSDGSLSRTGLDRLLSFLSRFMIRRTHVDKLMGAPIVSLPKASERIFWCKFNEFERAVYEMVRTRMIQRINRLSRSRQLENNYSNLLTMLLRLRQLTGHLITVEQPMKDLLEKEDHEKIYDLATAEATSHAQTTNEQVRWLRERLFAPESGESKPAHSAEFPGVEINGSSQNNDTRAESATDTPTRKDCSNVGRNHGRTFNFLEYLQDLRTGYNKKKAEERSACSYCNDFAEKPYVTQCYHVYCFECLNKIQWDAALKDREHARCVICQVEFTNSKPCDEFSFNEPNYDSDPTSDSDQEALRGSRRKSTHKKKKRKKNSEPPKAKDWIDMVPGNDILPSSKTMAIKAQVLNWIDDDPNVKIIIYTQFINMIRILSKVCNAERWTFTTYHGGKSQDNRDAAIQEFSKKPNLRIMLASLRCGGVGLNLTMAQKVIVVDPWWNSSAEQQAFCRVFRIGQASETSMTRFVVEKTVDENMIKMQEKKQAEIDKVMDGDKDRKLTIPELLRLFGDVEEDEDGNPFILVENRETLPNPNGDVDDDGFDED